MRGGRCSFDRNPYRGLGDFAAEGRDGKLRGRGSLQPPAVSAGYIKGLFHHLVAACGGVEAAGAFLGISHQRVSALQNINAPDLPPLLQVARLEAWCGQPIVTGALATLCEPHAIPDDLFKEACEATYAAADLQRAADEGATRRELRQRLHHLLKEVRDVEAAIAARDLD